MNTPLTIRIFLAILACFALGSGSSVAQPAQRIPSWDGSQSPQSGGLKGEVRAGVSGLPVAGARVFSAELGLESNTSASGEFAWENIRIDRPGMPISMTISAPGYGSWTVANLVLVPGDTLLLTPELVDQPVRVALPAQDAQSDASFIPARKKTISKQISQSKEIQNIPIPSNIRVRMTGKWECDPSAPYTVASVDFKEYVKHVLPNEWYYFWPRESLKAGAVAVKMYAWYFIESGGKWDDADVLDSTCDQWYVPFLSRESTNRAVEDTWSWMMTRGGMLFPPYHKDIAACDPPSCMRQSLSASMSAEGSTWDEILRRFYGRIELSLASRPLAGHALRFHGLPGDSQDANRLLIPMEASPENPYSPLGSVGEDDFTIEWWMKAPRAENLASSVDCGPNDRWMYGNILLDRYRPGGQPGFGFSLAGGAPVFGVTGTAGRSLTICGTAPIANGKWRHIAIQRRAADGALWLFVDGKLAAQGAGPRGGIGYPAGIETEFPDREPFISLGGWRMDTGYKLHPFFSGWIDELRFSNVLRYSTTFAPPTAPFQPDPATVALFHFDEGLGKTASNDTALGGDPVTGSLLFGGLDRGPEWLPSDLFVQYHQVYLPYVRHSSHP